MAAKMPAIHDIMILDTEVRRKSKFGQREREVTHPILESMKVVCDETSGKRVHLTSYTWLLSW